MINDQMLQQSSILALLKSCKFFLWDTKFWSSVVPNIYQKFNCIRFSYVCIVEYEHLKRFIWQKW